MHKKMINEAMRIAGEKVISDKTINVEYPFTGEVIGTVQPVPQSMQERL